MYLYQLKKNKDLKYSLTSFESSIPKNFFSNKKIRKFILQFNSPYKTKIKENDSVYTELFLTGENKDYQMKKTENTKGVEKIIILLHGFNSNLTNLRNYYYFINKALSNNYSCLFINLPFHLNRTPPGEKSGERLIHNKDMETLLFFHQSVLDVKKGIDITTEFLKQKYELKKIDFSICGISLGGMVSIITMAWENRIKKGIFLQCGGNWDQIYWNSLVRVIMRGCFIDKEKIKREQANKFYSVIFEFMDKYKKINPEKIDTGLKQYPSLNSYPQKTWFLSDPLLFAHKIKPENIIMINSKFDFLFCRESTNQLWKELSRPVIYWLNNFHTSSVLSNYKVLRLIFNFLDKTNIEKLIFKE